jgi:hypothetical protein
MSYPFNYGAFPQTFESPDLVDPDTNAKGNFFVLQKNWDKMYFYQNNQLKK